MTSQFEKASSGQYQWKVLLLFLALSLMTSLSGGRARAQVATASVVGTITDKSGAILPGAKVTLLSLDTGIAQNAVANSAGDFAFNLLPIGRYSLSVTMAAFESFKVSEITLAAGDRSRVNAEMIPGSVNMTVEVNTSASAAQTDSSTVGSLIDTKAVQELPLNGRNYINLVNLTPGVTAGTAPGGSQPISSGTKPDDRRQSSNYSANGQDPSANNNLIDGVDNNERLLGTIGVRLSIDAISEVKVQTNLYSAEVGRTSGGVVNILTKSGTNRFHGTAFEFLRNDLVDANSYYNFTNSAVVPKKPKYRQNQFGGSIGGPIRKDKTFFFGDYEGLRIVQGGTVTGIVVPTALERTGNFSESCTAFSSNGAANTFNAAGLCSDPTRQISLSSAQGGAPSGPIPFNRLDQGSYAGLVTPLGAKLASLYPLPSSGAVNSANYTATGNKLYYGHTFDVKVDHHFNDANTLRARYTFNKVFANVPGLFPSVNGINPGTGTSGVGGSFPGPNNTKAQNLLLNFVRIVKPNLLLDLNASYLRDFIFSENINYGNNTSTNLGIPGVNLGDQQTYGLVGLSIQGFQGLGDAPFVPERVVDNSFVYGGAVTWTKGSHNVRAGAGFVRRQFTILTSVTPRGSFTFNGATNSASAPILNGTALSGVGSTGNNNGAGLANLLLGTPVTLSRSLTPFAASYRTWEPYAFVQDDWRATKWLTLNLGLRYDIFTPKTEVKDRIGNLNIFTGQVLLPGFNTNRTTGIQTTMTNFAPRVGFAATVARNLVVRGGYGISYFPGDINSGALLKNPPFTPSLSCGPSTTTSCSVYGNYGTLAQGMFLPSVSYSTTTTPAGLTSISIAPGSGFVEIDQNFKSSYQQQFNLLVEKGFGKNVASVGYVGQVGRRLVLNPQNINLALPSGTSTPNPRPITVLNPNINSVQAWASAGISSYNSLQTSFQRRFSRGLSANAGYTWAHEIDDVAGLGATGSGGYGSKIGSPQTYFQNIQSYDRATGDFNVKHRGFFAANYELPKAHVGSLLAGAINGWQVNGTVIWQSGLPFTVTNASTRSGILGISGERPDRVARNLKVANPTVGNGATQHYLDVTAFAPQALYTLGNAGRSIGTGPRSSFVNASAFKNFALPRETELQFRTEVFNLPNHRNMGQPNTTFAAGSTSYGQITSVSAADAPRQIQFALKLQF